MSSKKSLFDKRKTKKQNRLHKLGEGGFGKVYESPNYPKLVFKVVDKRHSNFDKYKWFQTKLDSAEKGMRKKFLQYAVVKKPDKYLDGVNTYRKIVFKTEKMRYTLSDLYKHKEFFSLSEIVEISTFLLNILHFFEANSIVFTDLKMSNIMCNNLKAPFDLRVIDYINSAYSCNEIKCMENDIIHKTHSFYMLNGYSKLGSDNNYNFYYHRLLFGYLLFKMCFPHNHKNFHSGKFIKLESIISYLQDVKSREHKSLYAKRLTDFLLTLFMNEGKWSISTMLFEIKKIK